MTGQRLATLLVIALGYLVAVSVAVVVTVAIIFAPAALPDGGAHGSLLALLRDLPAFLIIGFMWTASCALPGCVVAIALGERRGWEGTRDYAVAGLANVVPSLAIFAVFVGSPFEMPMMVAGAFPGGLAGGAAYWLSAGRIVAGRRGLARHDVA